MKKLLILTAILIFACSTDSEGNPCIYEPTLTTEAVTDITETSATLNGVISIVSENCDVPNNTEQGFVYSTEIQPTLEDTQVNVNGTNISTTIDGLTPNTTYYVRAFLTNNLGDFYGDEVSFTTVAGQILLNTLPVSNITTNTAITGGEILSDGNTVITAKGVCWSLTNSPTIDDNFSNNYDSTTTFESIIEGLSPNTEYFVRAFATNQFGTYYGNEVSCNTNCIAPNVELNQQVDNVDGVISVEFNYVISNSEAYTIDNINLSYSYDNQTESFDVGVALENSLIYSNLIPINDYYDITLTIESEQCGDLTFNFQDFITPALYSVGDTAQGGIVIYMYPNGVNGIVASEIDAGEASWACDSWNSNNGELPWNSYIGTNYDSPNGWSGDIGDGDQNSYEIFDFIINLNGNDADGYFADWTCQGSACVDDPKAVELCYNFNHNGYDDWYLPHIKTLYIIFELKEQGVLSNFSNTSQCGNDGSMLYWSSCGDGANGGYVVMNDGSVGRGSFGGEMRVRPVRRF